MTEEMELLRALDIDVSDLRDILIAHYEEKNDCCETTEKESMEISRKLKILYYGEC